MRIIIVERWLTSGHALDLRYQPPSYLTLYIEQSNTMPKLNILR